MTTFKTGNPVGSTQVKDLYDNAENLDVLTNDRTVREHKDRLGAPRKTWYGMEQDFQDFLINSGYQQIGDYAAGLEITARNQVFWRDGELYRAGAVLELPYTTTGDWGAEEGLFVAVGDQVLRQQLADTEAGAALVGFPGGGTVADLRNPSRGDDMVAVSQPIEGALIRTQHEKNLDHVTVADFGVPISPADATPYFAALESSSQVKTVDLLGGEFLVTGIDLKKFYYNGNVFVDGKPIVRFIDKYRSVKGAPRVGLIPMPASFDNRLGATVMYSDGKYRMSDVFRPNDWARDGAGTEVFVSYLTGLDTNPGTREQPYKTMTKVFNDAKVRNTRAVILDRFMPRQAAGQVARDSSIGIDFNLKISAGHSSGEAIIGNFNDPALFTWTRVGSSSVYSAVAAETKAVFDARFRDAKGLPRPLVLRASAAEVDAHAGSWYFDMATSTVYVRLENGRIPENDVLVCQSVGSWTFNIPVDGSLSIEGIKTIFAYNIWDGFRITPRGTSPNTARFAAKNCAYIGADFNGLAIARVGTVAQENCIAAYNARDGFSYHDVPIPSPMVVYESSCSAYENGAEIYAINPANTGSDNASTAHEGMTIVRVNCQYPESKNGVVADVNGCLSINFGVSSGESRSATPINRASFAFNDTNTASPGVAFLIGCSGGTDTTVSISSETFPSDIRVANWEGELTVYPGTTVRTLDGNVVA